VIGILAGAGSDLRALAAVVGGLHSAQLVPLVVSDTGGQLGSGSDAVAVQRSLLSGRSIEFDGLLVADGRAATAKTDLMISEAFRHAKAIGAWGDGAVVISHAGCRLDAPGVVVGEEPGDVVASVLGLLAKHRVWERTLS
jgi:catalase